MLSSEINWFASVGQIRAHRTSVIVPRVGYGLHVGLPLLPPLHRAQPASAAARIRIGRRTRRAIYRAVETEIRGPADRTGKRAIIPARGRARQLLVP